MKLLPNPLPLSLLGQGVLLDQADGQVRGQAGQMSRECARFSEFRGCSPGVQQLLDLGQVLLGLRVLLAVRADVESGREHHGRGVHRRDPDSARHSHSSLPPWFPART